LYAHPVLNPQVISLAIEHQFARLHRIGNAEFTLERGAVFFGVFGVEGDPSSDAKTSRVFFLYIREEMVELDSCELSDFQVIFMLGVDRVAT
jgi:hypothetical protein